MRWLQVIIAIMLGLAVLRLGMWGIRVLATPQPPDPDPEDVIEVSVAYRCSICGLRLTVTHALDEEAPPPRHCREDMDPIHDGTDPTHDQ